MNKINLWVGSAVLTTLLSIPQSYAASSINSMQDLISQTNVQSIQVHYLNIRTSPTNPNLKKAFQVSRRSPKTDAAQKRIEEGIFSNILNALGENDYRTPLTRVKEDVCKKEFDRSQKQGHLIPYGLVYYINQGNVNRFSLKIIPCSLTTQPTQDHWAVALMYNSNRLNDDHYVRLSQAQVQQLAQWSIKGIRQAQAVAKTK